MIKAARLMLSAKGAMTFKDDFELVVTNSL